VAEAEAGGGQVGQQKRKERNKEIKKEAYERES
jgi:hypothetical protein